MKKQNFIIGFIFTAILGTLMHFFYEWSGENPLVGAFSPVNESVWEHLKLLFFPTFIYGIYEYFSFGRKMDCFFISKLKAALLSVGFITVFYYIYTGIIGFNIDFLNIASFIIGVAIYWITEYRSLNKDKYCMPICNILSFAGIILLAILFVTFTFNTPKIGLFKDPQTLKYGIEKLINM